MPDVWITAAAKSEETVYHTNKECVTIQKTERLRQVEKAELREEYRPCTHPSCTGDHAKHREIVNCPLCGAETKQLPNHIPKCPNK